LQTLDGTDQKSESFCCCCWCCCWLMVLSCLHRTPKVPSSILGFTSTLSTNPWRCTTVHEKQVSSLWALVVTLSLQRFFFFLSFQPREQAASLPSLWRSCANW
jgi:hypothetical protein